MISLVTNGQPTGLTLTARVYFGAAIAGTASFTESPAVSGRYTASYNPDGDVGAHDFIVVDGDGIVWANNGSFEADADGNEITLSDIDGALGDVPTTGLTAEQVWTYISRTLSSFPPSTELLFPQPGVGVFVPGAQQEGWPATLTVSAIAGSTIVLLARMVHVNGNYITQAVVTTATSQVLDPDGSDETAVNETVSSIIFDTLQMNGQWSEDTTGYNMRVVINGARIPTAKKLYTVIVTLTTASGPIKRAWSIQT